MKILKYQKINKNKYKVFLDNNTNITLYEDVILKNNLLLKKEIDADLYEELIEENNIADIYNICLKYISVRIRSVKEMTAYLSKKGIDENVIKTTIDSLINKGYLSDEIFTKYFIKDKINLTNDGPYKITNYLKSNDINEELINKYLTEYTDIFKVKINKLINKFITINKSYSGNILKTKIYNNLVNLGYDKSMIIEIINNYTFNSKNIKKIYDSLYKKYSKKYNNEELEKIIRQKLYQKGYTNEDIENM